MIAGNGSGGSQYRGAAPAATIRSYGSSYFTSLVARDAAVLDITNSSYSVGSPNGWDNANWTLQGATTAKQYSSWNYNNGTTYYRDKNAIDYEFGQYSSTSRSTDAVLFDNPDVLSFFSAGNTRGNLYSDYQGDKKYVARFSPGFVPVNGTRVLSRTDRDTGTVTDLSSQNYWLVSTADYVNPTANGYDTVSHVSATKNTIVVGATVFTDNDSNAKSINSTIQTSFSNYGPTDDGRLGVMLMAQGNALRAATPDTISSYTQSTSGTSFSSPSAAGTAALILELWRQKGQNPNSAMQKAALIHTATDIAGGGQYGPDYRTGYGLINGKTAAAFVSNATQADVSKRTMHAIQANIKNGQELTYTFQASSADVWATLVWTDPEGVAHSGSQYVNDRDYRALVNDLDLWITDANGNVYFPWTLDPNNPNAAAVKTQRNDVDNIEQVMINTGLFAIGSLFTVHVGLDGILSGVGSLGQAYSLAVTGGTIAIPEPAILAVVAMLAGGVLRRRRVA
ncbi:MAG: S8 family serine peptidase [Tepidisphaeraceae bacterium]